MALQAVGIMDTDELYDWMCRHECPECEDQTVTESHRGTGLNIPIRKCPGCGKTMQLFAKAETN